MRYYYSKTTAIKYLLLLSFYILIFNINSISLAENTHPSILNANAYKYYLKGDYDTAITIYQEAINIHSSYAPLFDGIANVYLKKDNYQEAYLNYKKASNIDPENSLYKVHSQKAVYLGCLNKIESSKHLLNRAISNSSNNPAITRNINKISASQFQDLEFITDFYQDRHDKFLTQANSARWIKNYKKANQFYVKSIVGSNKQSYQGYNNLALVYIDQKKYNNALHYLNKAIENNPKDFVSYNNIGVVYYLQNDYKKAIENFDKALELNDKYSSAYNNKYISTVKDSLKNLDPSIEYLESLIRYEPNNTLGKKLLLDLKTLAGIESNNQ